MTIIHSDRNSIDRSTYDRLKMIFHILQRVKNEKT